MYDIFYVGPETLEWKQIKQKFPLSKRVDNFQTARQKSFTVYFWVVWPGVTIANDFKFDYKVSKWDEEYIHVFRNGEFYDGICLFSKKTSVSERELNYRFFANKKEVDVVASIPEPYEVFYIDTYEDYLNAKTSSVTDMFWVVWSDLTIADDFKFDYKVPKWDEKYIHVFRNGEFYDGICLLSKKSELTKKEINFRFFTDKKEVDVVASIPEPYEVFYIDTYEDYLNAKTSSVTDMFWVVWSDLTIADDFKFDYYIPHYDSFHKNITHVFRNGEFYDGICLFSKKTSVSEREFNHRFFANKKEIDIQASSPLIYNSFTVDTYNDYLKAKEDSITNMFWCIPKEVTPTNDFKFDLYFSHHNSYDRAMHHVFKHQFNNTETFNGVMLLSKKLELTKKEIDFRFLITKKEYNIVASTHNYYDIVFISYNEPNAEENFKILKSKFPNVKRVHGVKGIHQAHIEAAKLIDSHMFWVVDGDAIIEDTFNFDYLVTRYEKDIVHVWKSRNPINGLVYGYGGVKLLPTDLTLNMDATTLDMTTAISNRFKPMPIVSNITAFNTDPFNTWKSAFRECVKLSSSMIARQNAEETLERLKVWCTLVENVSYGYYAYLGALAGKQYGQENAGNLPALALINDFDWLMLQFQQVQQPLEK